MHNRHRQTLAALLLATASCKHQPPPPPSPPPLTISSKALPEAPLPAAPTPAVADSHARTPGTPVSAGSLRAARVLDAYAVLVPVGGDAELARRSAEAVAPADGLEDWIEVHPTSEAHIHLNLLKYFGRGVTEADETTLRQAVTAITIDVEGPGAAPGGAVHHAARAARAAAAAVHGWICDVYTSEVFTVAAFDDKRPDNFPLDVRNLAVAHEVAQDDGSVFIETFGLQRLGIPELYVAGVPRSFAEDALGIINAAAQSIADAGAVSSDGVLVVDVTKLTVGSWPEAAVAIRKRQGTGIVRFTAIWSRGDDEDPNSAPEIALTLPGPGFAQRLGAAIGDYYGGRDDQVHYAEANDQRLAAIRVQAQEALKKLAPRFAEGVPQQERLAVKAPFRTSAGGVEWMWVDVQKWQRGKLIGVLMNEPDDVPELKTGARVEVRLAELADYKHFRADGTTVGGESDAVVQGE